MAREEILPAAQMPPAPGGGGRVQLDDLAHEEERRPVRNESFDGDHLAPAVARGDLRPTVGLGVGAALRAPEVAALEAAFLTVDFFAADAAGRALFAGAFAAAALSVLVRPMGVLVAVAFSVAAFFAVALTLDAFAGAAFSARTRAVGVFLAAGPRAVADSALAAPGTAVGGAFLVPLAAPLAGSSAVGRAFFPTGDVGLFSGVAFLAARFPGTVLFPATFAATAFAGAVGFLAWSFAAMAVASALRGELARRTSAATVSSRG